jgi:lysozyme family protein
MRANLAVAMKLTAGAEGGFSNHPKDPGGATMKGVTLRTYSAYRRRKGMPTPSVADLKRISDAEVEEIFRTQYWDAVKGDELPAGVDITAADFSFNSGGAQAMIELQRALTGLGYDTKGADGKFGNHTAAALVAAMRGAGEDKVINVYLDRRLAFMRKLSTWPTFKNGWTNRVKDMRAAGLRVAHADPTFEPLPLAPVARAEPTAVRMTALAGAKPMLTSVGGTVAAAATAGAQQLLSNSTGQPPSYLVWAILGFLALTAVGGVLGFLAVQRKAAQRGTV